MIDTHYRAWFDDGLVERFARKAPAEFFRSETYFLERIGADVRSVLDIGCASGRFLRLLEHYAPGCAYTGIDLVDQNLERAREAFPGATFLAGNGLTVSPGGSFDLVNATGVMQAEPRWRDLLDRMIAHSRRYVLFDVKLVAAADDIVDLDRSFVSHEAGRLYCILLSTRRFLGRLHGLTGIGRARVYGYETPLNPRTTIPPGLAAVASAGVLLEKGRTADCVPAVSVELPESLWRAHAGSPR